MRHGLFASPRPDNLGLHDGLLAPAPSTPNGVSSQASDSKHYVAPLPMPTDCCLSAMEKMHSIIESMGHAEIISTDDGYLHAEFHTPLLGFVDDVEIVCNEQEGVCHVRSVSRMGHSDLGKNRQRVEDIRHRLEGWGYCS
ncbi:DUF1499 domain-containing protein [Cobetia marina]|jgi:uncharacterized protein (DUF1499 family)|uniref:DUF1499 domain-containing protein n=1 Tax=Cobetia marina TaxID=28258 RepID=A0ABU9GFG8_COBMA|nr:MULTISPECIES: DUF1499 domain-containing protein [Cobetia]AOM02298.1 hypothetical protein BFX80_14760 [Cobetia marina]AZV32137.1 DUF1499 domain-containing protein [Cobetia sp. ICG0124]MDA5563096.1 DUF1499 domain-containing protein [Cobetia sp. MMG027]MDH2292534.1 DUF1499 domain-containing protein [Cobetia sp. 10Alg 146]MDI6003317.1 DUF1499 domain-containing protein [Cobetia pacifica]